MASGGRIAVVIPVFNERESLEALATRLDETLAGLDRPSEVVFVDDGSTDGSLDYLRTLAERPGRRVVALSRNAGQHAAVWAGLSVARGEIVVTLDADLQNPPEEIPSLVRAMEEGGFDLVGSVRRTRRDSPARRANSALVNAATGLLVGARVSDWGCMLRAYRRDVVDRLLASGESPLFIPAQAFRYARNPDGDRGGPRRARRRAVEVPPRRADRAGAPVRGVVPPLPGAGDRGDRRGGGLRRRRSLGLLRPPRRGGPCGWRSFRRLRCGIGVPAVGRAVARRRHTDAPAEGIIRTVFETPARTAP